MVITMPMLSPTMTEGSLLKWTKEPGDKLEPYDLLFELETESLTEEAYRLGDFAGAHPHHVYLHGRKSSCSAKLSLNICDPRQGRDANRVCGGRLSC